MSQVIVTFENGADSSFLRKIIENLKGVLKVSAPIPQDIEASDTTTEWINMLHSVKNEINPALIDMTDERTKHIMSK